MKAASHSAERSNQATEQVGATIDRKKETRSQNPTWQAFSLGVQAKLSVSSPDDPSEHEADRVADQVTRTSNAASPLYQRVAIQTKPLGVPNIQRLCGACESHKDEEELHLHRKADDGYVGSTLSDVHAVVNTPGVGASLSDNLRQRIEPVLGADLSSVRVHSDARSQSAATEIGAKAFTHQNNIYLGRGQDSNDLGLMAHESTHVVQQGFAGASALQRKPTDAHIIQRETDGSVWDRIGSAVSSGGETLLDYGSRGVTAVGEGVGAVVDAGGAVVSTGLGMARDAVVGLVESYAPGAVAFFGNLTNYVKQRAAAGFNALFGGLPGRIAEGGLAGALEFIFVDLIGGVWQGIGSAVGASCSAMGAVANVLMDIGNRLGAEAVAVVQQGASSVADFLSGLWEQYGVPATEAISSFASGIWEDISTTVSGWWDALAPIREAASEAWDWVVSTFMEGSSMVNQFLTGIFQKLVEEWDALKEKLRPYMTYVQIAIGVLLLMSPMGPFIAAGAVAYGAYRLVSYLWEVIGQPMVASVRQLIADTIMPQIDGAIAGLQEAIEGAKQWLSNLVDRLAAAGMGLLGAIGALPLINMAGQLFASLSEQFQQFANTAKQKIEEFATAARQLFAQFMTFISPVVEFIRQLVLISVFGPLAILDDGVWATMQSVAAFAMTVPCVREMVGLMQLPLIMKGAERFRNMLKAAWKIIQNPQPIIDALHNALQPMIDAVPGVAATLMASVIYPTEPQHRAGVERHLEPAVRRLQEHWWEELLNMGSTLIWPWGEVANKLPQMLDKGASAIEAFFNLEISTAIDDFLAMMQDVNAILGALWGWFALAAVLIGGVLGALGVEFTAGASIGAGIAAGWAVAEEVGLVLLGAMVVTELGIMGKSMFDIRFNNELITDPDRKAQANDQDYEHIANSTFSLAVVTAMVVLGAVAQKLASAIWEFAKATVPGLEAASEAISESVSSVLDRPRGRTGTTEPLPGAVGDATAGADARGSGASDTHPTDTTPADAPPNDTAPGDTRPADAESPSDVVENSPEDIARTNDALRDAVRDPENIREVTDPAMRERGYDAEVDVGDHTYRRNSRTGTWCRFSDPVCGISIPDASAAVDSARSRGPLRDANDRPIGVTMERPIPEGGISIAERRAQGGRIPSRVTSELDWYYDGANDVYARRPSPLIDPNTGLNVPATRRPIPVDRPPLLDANGRPVEPPTGPRAPLLDAQGNPVGRAREVSPLVDEHGNPVTDLGTDISDDVSAGTRTKPTGEGWNHAPNWEKWVNERGGRIAEHADGSVTFTASDGTRCRYSPEGDPNFTPFLGDNPWGIREIEIGEFVDRRVDFREANRLAGHPEWGDRSPPGYTWHHARGQPPRLQLVPRGVHDIFDHSGGMAEAAP